MCLALTILASYSIGAFFARIGFGVNYNTEAPKIVLVTIEALDCSSSWGSKQYKSQTSFRANAPKNQNQAQMQQRRLPSPVLLSFGPARARSFAQPGQNAVSSIGSMDGLPVVGPCMLACPV